MTGYTCERCLKEFAQKSHYNTHMKRKTPCQNNKEKIKKEVEKRVNPELQNVIVDEATSQVDSMELKNKIETMVKNNDIFVDKLMMIVDDVGDGWKLFESAVLLGDVLTVCVGVNEVGMEVG